MPAKASKGTAQSPADIIIGNIARMSRQRAHERGMTIERYFATTLPGVIDDEESTILLLQALTRIAIEDDRNGGGPLASRAR